MTKQVMPNCSLRHFLKHNIPSAISENAGNSFRTMFLDYKTAQKYSFAKAYALVQYVAGDIKKILIFYNERQITCLLKLLQEISTKADVRCHK